jgi:GNAT superfamily N-acetyltransferase
MRVRGESIRPFQQDLSQSALVRANEDNAVAFFEWARHVPGVEIDHRPDRFRVSTGIAHPVFNGVRSARLASSEAGAWIDETRAYFASRGERWLWWLWPSSEPADLGDRLASREMVSRGSMPAMSVDLRALPDAPRPPERLSIVRVTDARMLDTWVHLAGAIFGLADGAPTRRFVEVFSASGFDEEAPMQFYTGFLDGAPVAASQLFLGAGVAGIYTAATVAEHRGRGFGTALTVAPLLEASARGYRWGILQATKMGEPVYRRIGFRVDGQIVLFGLPPPVPEARAP